jgi:glycosyl transferase family 25
MENIHKIVYINLDKRQDRRAEIESEFVRMGLSGERFQAIERRPGILGCGLSHLAVLKRAEAEGWENVLIFEDDFHFIVDKDTFNQIITNFFSTISDWDVLMLSYVIESSRPYNEMFGYVSAATTASGYLVHRRFYKILIQVLETAMPSLEHTGHHWRYANDQCWKAVQSSVKWFYSLTRIGIQRASYSDNSYEFMDRGV